MSAMSAFINSHERIFTATVVTSLNTIKVDKLPRFKQFQKYHESISFMFVNRYSYSRIYTAKIGKIVQYVIFDHVGTLSRTPMPE